MEFQFEDWNWAAFPKPPAVSSDKRSRWKGKVFFLPGIQLPGACFYLRREKAWLRYHIGSPAFSRFPRLLAFRLLHQSPTDARDAILPVGYINSASTAAKSNFPEFLQELLLNKRALWQ